MDEHQNDSLPQRLDRLERENRMKVRGCVTLVVSMILLSALSAIGQEKISGHLGLAFGMNMLELKTTLKKNPCISKTNTGEATLERVPLKPYYRTWCRYRPNLDSEVTLWIDVERGIEQVRESFNGETISTLVGARREFARLKMDLSNIWGNPAQEAKDLVVWEDESRAAILRVIPPDHPMGLPILKLVVSVHGLTSTEMQKTLAGRVF